jgi:hypothetical protein
LVASASSSSPSASSAPSVSSLLSPPLAMLIPRPYFTSASSTSPLPNPDSPDCSLTTVPPAVGAPPPAPARAVSCSSPLEELDIFALVSCLRQSRALMVQSNEQYCFLHKFIAHALSTKVSHPLHIILTALPCTLHKHPLSLF